MGRKFLIIDDSALMRRVISDIIKQNSEYEVLDIAVNGVEGLDKMVAHPRYYDLVILDINMPKMNGIEVLEMLQKNHMKEAVVVVSTLAKEGAKETIQALELGALDFVTKPENFYEVKGEDFKTKIVNMIEMVTGKDLNRNRLSDDGGKAGGMGRLKNVMEVQRQSRVEPDIKAAALSAEATAAASVGLKRGKDKLVAIACSTGGPKSLQSVIPLLPANLDAGVVLVQHMPKGFTASLAQRLNMLSKVEVSEAVDGEVIKKGHVYIAPGGIHIKVCKEGTNHVIRLDSSPAVDGLRPCANIMYESLKETSYDEITCVVLTGMGADGTKGIKSLFDAHKNLHVIGQDADSCVVYGMPRAIADAGLVNEVRSLDNIAESIIKNVGVM
ncbi:MAG: chemotaxis-specific protein-glutamate methyltransferase CheB [Butyrivibrio sp.]|nr:chemotaxis-specific protein-glutamate methyltransferase CheB [Butyrivibrio sp.]